MRFLSRLFGSTVGLKIVMALTGVLLLLWVIAHMLGNLQIFVGSEMLNAYAKLLKTSPEVLWAQRLVMLVLALLHVFSSLRLTELNREARPVAYDEIKFVKSSLASRTMIVSGLILLAFIVFHLWQFTVQGTAHLLPLRDGYVDVYGMVVEAFKNPLTVIFYVISVGLLGLHLSHGAKSWFRSLGWSSQSYSPAQENFALIVGLVLFLGFAAVPLACLLGFIR